MLLKIEDEKSFLKNLNNNSLVNNDKIALHEYKNKKQLNTKVNSLSEEINNMKSDISDIKNLLIQLVKSNSTEK